MKDILWLVSKTLRVTFRDGKNILFYLITPLAGILIALFAYGEQEGEMTLGVVNNDNESIASETVAYLKGMDKIQVREMNRGDVTEDVTAGHVDVVLILGKGFSKSILAGRPDHIALTSIKGESVTGVVKSFLYQHIDNLTLFSKAADGNTDVFSGMYQGYLHRDFGMQTTTLQDTSTGKMMAISSFGFLIMIMMYSAANLSEIILAEKENRTYFRLLSTPITARKYIFSNVIVNMIVMLVQVLLTLVFLIYVFRIDLSMPAWKAFVVMGIFSLIAVGLSLVIITFANSRKASGALINLIIIPTVMLSGSFWPVEVMPEAVQKISRFLPQRWTLDTLEQLQEGSTFGSLYLNILILFAFAAAFFLFALYKFSRNNDTKSFI